MLYKIKSLERCCQLLNLWLKEITFEFIVIIFLARKKKIFQSSMFILCFILVIYVSEVSNWSFMFQSHIITLRLVCLPCLLSCTVFPHCSPIPCLVCSCIVTLPSIIALCLPFFRTDKLPRKSNGKHGRNKDFDQKYAFALHFSHPVLPFRARKLEKEAAVTCVFSFMWSTTWSASPLIVLPCSALPVNF